MENTPTTAIDKPQRTISYIQLYLAITAFIVAFLVWQSTLLWPLVYPLRLFVTFIHESGHGLAAIMTGGEFIRFELQSTGAGLAYSKGGIRPVIIAAGYTGTALFGAVLLYFTHHVKRPEWIAIGLGIVFSLLSIFYTGLSITNFSTLEAMLTGGILFVGGWLFLTRETDQGRWFGLSVAGFGLLMMIYSGTENNLLSVLVGVISGIALIVMGYHGLVTKRSEITIFVLTFLAFIVGLNAITDTWFLFRIVSNSDLMIHNDAISMEDDFILPAMFWAVVWIASSVMLLGSSIWLTFILPLRRAGQNQQMQPAQTEQPRQLEINE